MTSRRWAYTAPYIRENLMPVKNPHPSPEPQPLREHPFDTEINGDGTKVYIALQGSEMEPDNEVAVYDVKKEKIIKRISLKLPRAPGPPASSPFRLVTHPDGRFLFVTSRYSNFSSVIDTRTDEVVLEVPTDFYCMGMAFDQEGNTLYITNRYLDQVFVIDIDTDGERLQAKMREPTRLSDRVFCGEEGQEGIHDILVRHCGSSDCHAELRGGFVAGSDPMESFLSSIEHIHPGNSAKSRLLQSTIRTRHGGYADLMPKYQSHAYGTVVFNNPQTDPDYRAIATWIDAASEGPGIPVGNFRSKPKTCAITRDNRYLFVGNTGTQDISIIDTKLNREVGGIYIQNVINDLNIYHSPETGHDYLIVTTEGIGFGAGRERDPYGGETWDPSNPAAHYSVWRNMENGSTLPKDQQTILGPFDAIDGTAGIKFRDIQNDLIFVDIDALKIPEQPPEDGLSYLLFPNRYESHRQWVRYTCDTAESTYGDIKGDIPPDLMRVVGAFPEKIAIIGDHLFVTMQSSNQVQELKINPTAPDPSDYLIPVALYTTGMQPIGITAGPPGTPAEGKVFVSNFLGGSLTVIDTECRTSHDVVIDSSVVRIAVPATNAERGETFAHTALQSSDGDVSCFHCHYLDIGDGRPWGVSQVVAQEYLNPDDAHGQFVINGTMSLPQMRGLFFIQPFFFEGVISVFEPRSMIMEQCPTDDFKLITPQGDFTDIEAHYVISGADDIQANMDSGTKFKSTLEERRDEMFRKVCMDHFGKAFTMRDFVRFVGEWQIHEPRLLPNPFDSTHPSVLRGRLIFEDPQVGCSSCHPAPHFTKKDFPDSREQAMEPVVTFSVRDASFTLIGMNRLDYINSYRRDLNPWDAGRIEREPGLITTFPLRGIWDRPPSFLHSGMARTIREVACMPGHPALGTYKYEPRIGGEPERPGRKEVGCNMTFVYASSSPHVKMQIQSGARLGFDTHGGSIQLTRQQIDDLVNFINTIE